MTKDRDKALRRAILEDLVRIVAEVRKLLNRDLPELHRPGGGGRWSLAEVALHIVLVLEDCHQRFEEALDENREPPTPPSFTQILNQKMILTTFRYPSQLQALQGLVPGIMLTGDEICSRLEEAKDHLLRIEAILIGRHKTFLVQHPRFGAMSFFHWVRLVLIHTLHHKSQI